MKIFTYASIEQSQFEQDIEVKKFNTGMRELLDYAFDRIGQKEDVVYVGIPVWLSDHEEIRNVMITEHFIDIWEYVFQVKGIKGGLSVYEFESYEDAFKYLSDLFDGRKLSYNK